MSVDLDDPCYVFGLTLDGGGGAVEFEPGHDGNSWIHIDYSLGNADQFLQRLNLPELVIDALTRQDTRPRALVSSAGTLLLLRGINLNPGADPEDMVSIRIWIEPHRIITVRQRRLLAAQSMRDDLLAGKGPASIESLVVELIERIADRVFDYVSQVDDRLGELEEQIQGRSPSAEDRLQLSDLRREIASVRRYVSPQRDALESLYNQRRELLGDTERFALREQVDRMLRYVEDLELLRERAMVLQEELLNIIAEIQNNRMYALSIVAAIFLPITFVTGLFGMNVAGLPGVEDPSAFLYVAASMTVLTVAVVVFFKSNRWL